MNEISILLNYIVDWFKADELVGTVVLAADFEIDSQKENIYPIVAINFRESDPLADTIVGYFDITVLQQRNVSPDKQDSKLMFDSNMIDNWNETHAICNKFIRNLEFQNNEQNIELVSRTRLTTIKNRPTNGLDGYKFNCGISIPNKTESCSQS